VSTADAVQREADWLRSYSASDGLPGLLKAYGGPFDVVQAYVPRTGAQRQSRLYVTRSALRVERFGFNRRINHHTFMLRLYWPQSSPTGQAESVQQAFDTAVDAVVQRVSGLFQDKTHGARFLSVAEDPMQIDVQFTDPEATIQAKAELTATITYQADDQDYTS
jgi:hypothetical protein